MSREPGEPREHALLRLALEVAVAADGAVVFARELIEHDAGPLAGRELCLADELDHARLAAVDKHPLTDDEAVRVRCQNDIRVYQQESRLENAASKTKLLRSGVDNLSSKDSNNNNNNEIKQTVTNPTISAHDNG